MSDDNTNSTLGYTIYGPSSNIERTACRILFPVLLAWIGYATAGVGLLALAGGAAGGAGGMLVSAYVCPSSLEKIFGIPRRGLEKIIESTESFDSTSNTLTHQTAHHLILSFLSEHKTNLISILESDFGISNKEAEIVFHRIFQWGMDNKNEIMETYASLSRSNGENILPTPQFFGPEVIQSINLISGRQQS